MAVQATGSRTVPMLEGGDVAGAEEETFSAIGVENKVTSPGIVSRLKMRATTATGAVTSLATARSRRRRESRCATAVAKPDTWPVSVTMPTSRNATPAEALVTSRSFVIKSSVTGVVRLVTSQCIAVNPMR